MDKPQERLTIMQVMEYEAAVMRRVRILSFFGLMEVFIKPLSRLLFRRTYRKYKRYVEFMEFIEKEHLKESLKDAWR